MISQKTKETILECIFAHMPKEHVLIFCYGSGVTGDLMQSSDIDLGMILGSAVTLGVLATIKSELNELPISLRDIELVVFDSNLDKTFLQTALKEIDLWWPNQNLMPVLSSLKAL